MTPPYSSTNSSSSPFPFELSNEDHDHHQNHTHNFTTTNYHVSSSSSAHSQPSHLFLNPTWYQPQLYCDSDPQFFYPQQHKVDNHAANGGSYDQGPKKQVTLWRSTKKEENCEDSNDHRTHEVIPVKWMSSKMRVMQKMKSSDRAAMGASMASAATTITTTTTVATATAATTTTMKIEDQKRASSSLEPEYSSNSSSNNSSSNNVPIRVCADCNTTKTPLWRSGPKGPKSLCNACGIRQRKARRAMAAAAAAAANCAAATEAAASTSLKIKVKPTKEKTTAAKNTTGVNHHHHHVTPFKKRCKIVAAADQQAKKTKKKMNGFDDFLIKLSKNSAAYHRVFPQDEKDAAILLMALSCGLVQFTADDDHPVFNHQ